MLGPMRGHEAAVRAAPPERRRILVADDEQEMRWTLCTLLRTHGLEPLEAADGASALRLMEEGGPDCVLLDVRMPGMGGLEVLRRARRFDRATPIIVITGFGSVDSAVEAMKNGACHYITKPFEHAKLMAAIREVLRASNGGTEEPVAAEARPGASTLREAMGPSKEVSRIIRQVAQVAPTNFSVVIAGETGSGKELVARAIHAESGRRRGPFVAVDCGSIPPTLFESEVFGWEKGAFTGADRSRPGLFELACGGTLFFDEVSNLPGVVQPKLLRALQERQIWRVGGREGIRADVRLVCATNSDLAGLVQRQRFRRDLFFRINEFSIALPPLRERPGDILYLAERFLTLTNQELGKRVTSISPEAEQALLRWRWPGNVRELRNAMRRAVLVADGRVEAEHLHLPDGSGEPGVAQAHRAIVRKSVMKVEQEVLARVLEETDGNKAEAARLLQIDYKTLLSKARAYGLACTLRGRGRQGGA
jgi:DNA-binding NtrC family response regulator